MARRHVSRSFATSRRNPRISMDEVRELAENQPTPLSLQQMKLFAAAGDKLRLVSAIFLHKELQIRFARAIMELSDLPIGLSKTASVQKAIGVYCNELLLLKGMDPPSTSEEDMAFTDAIKKAKGRGMNLVPLICGGLQEIKATDLGSNALRLESVQEDIMHRLDTFFLSRIGIRMLIGQHVESLEQAGGRVELVNVEATVRSACQRAAKLCKKYKGQAPEVEISLAANASAPFIYVESHLHHMVFEIVKNSMRATVEYHEGLQQKKSGRLNRLEHVMNPLSKHLGFVLPAVQEVQGVTIYPDVRNYRRPGELPPIQIVISQGQEDLTIKVSDEGGGVPRSKWPKIWHYDYTTSPPYPLRDSYGFHSFRQQFSGGGYGLPIARLFARYFGGEVTFISLEGSGSTAFIQAHRLGTKAEVVPGHATFSLQPLYSESHISQQTLTTSGRTKDFEQRKMRTSATMTATPLPEDGVRATTLSTRARVPGMNASSSGAMASCAQEAPHEDDTDDDEDGEDDHSIRTAIDPETDARTVVISAAVVVSPERTSCEVTEATSECDSDDDDDSNSDSETNFHSDSEPNSDSRSDCDTTSNCDTDSDTDSDSDTSSDSASVSDFVSLSRLRL